MLAAEWGARGDARVTSSTVFIIEGFAMHRQIGKSKSGTNRLASCRRNVLACALAGGLALTGSQAMAQSAAASLRGSVSTQSGPAAGEEVVVTNIANGAVRRTIRANGSYRCRARSRYLPREAGPGSTRTGTRRASSATLDLCGGAAAEAT